MWKMRAVLKSQEYFLTFTTFAFGGSSVFCPQQRKWCKRELGEDVPVITCMSRDKHTYCRPGNVLIDDRYEFCLGTFSLGSSHHRCSFVFMMPVEMVGIGRVLLSEKSSLAFRGTSNETFSSY